MTSTETQTTTRSNTSIARLHATATRYWIAAALIVGAARLAEAVIPHGDRGLKLIYLGYVVAAGVAALACQWTHLARSAGPIRDVSESCSAAGHAEVIEQAAMAMRVAVGCANSAVRKLNALSEEQGPAQR